MLTIPFAVMLGIFQGVTELFPVSSLGLSVLLPQLLGWHIDEGSAQFVAFLAATHFATALVLLGFFWREWTRIIAGILRSLYRREISRDDMYARLGWLLVIGTVPTGIIGLLFQTQLEMLFGAGTLVAAALTLNGFMLFGADALRKHALAGQDVALAKLSHSQAALIGVAQSLALVPGFSRTGAAITGGLLNGLSHEDAARFAFLLATPIIFAAALLNVPEVLSAGPAFAESIAVGFVCAGAAAYLSVRFLTQYFKTNTLKPFAIFCVAAGLLSLAILLR